MVLVLARFLKKRTERRPKVVVLFGTETGNSERYAARTGLFFETYGSSSCIELRELFI